MKLTSPFTILSDALKSKSSENPTCFIDETEVSMKECGVQIEEPIELPKLSFWDAECQAHPTNAHCRMFE